MRLRLRRSRGTNLRVKIAALLASLVLLWAFAAWVTLLQGVNLLGVQAISNQIVTPSEPLLLQLQQERRLSLAYLGKPSSQQREALNAGRQKTDALAAAFRTSSQSWMAKVAASTDAEQRLSTVYGKLDSLTATRASIDGRAVDRGSAETVYTGVIDSLFRLYDSVGELNDQQVAADTRNLIDLYKTRELMSQEDALLTGALAAGQLTPAEYTQFVRLVGAQRFLGAATSSKLRPSDQVRYDAVTNSKSLTQYRDLEDRVIQYGRVGAKLPVSTVEWETVSTPALTDLQNMVLGSGKQLVTRATPVGVLVILRLVLAVGLGTLAVIAAVIVSVTTARALVAQLERLRNAAHELADERLPSVVARLGRGETVDVAAEAPPLDFGDDEIGQVGQAFNRVQETAVRTAVEQAELRRSVRDVFLSLARRTQALVHRQVTLLDAMQRRELPDEQLSDLYGVDHLATRMRRNAENLIVLSGATPGRAWRRNVPMVDVVRGAVQEVEDYTRVKVRPLGPVGLAGRAVSDVIHLLAELIENALSFSPPHTEVEIKGQMVANGYVIEIEDRGLGMAEDDLVAANEQIASQQEFNLSNAARLGLYVVSRLTKRHGIRVQLKESPYGGTTAVVLIPHQLVTDGTAQSETSGPVLNGRAAAVDGGRANDARMPSQPAHSVVVAEPAAPPVDLPLAGAGLPPLQRRQPRNQAWKDLSAQIDPELDPTMNGDHPRTAPADPAEASYTPSGLPFRVRQASLARPLRDGTAAPTDDGANEDLPRSPDQVRRIMSSYQSGTHRGRVDAARLIDDDEISEQSAPPAPGDSPTTGEQPLT